MYTRISSVVTVAVPRFSTTTTGDMFARYAASCRVVPTATPAEKAASAVSPAHGNSHNSLTTPLSKSLSALSTDVFSVSIPTSFLRGLHLSAPP